jgi:predicted ArsR family transcriptional regulator
VAEQFSAACGSELAFISTVLPEAEVEREHHIMAGELLCAYRIRRRTADSFHG